MVGYARVSTDDQLTTPQSQELRAAGCDQIHEEQASGGSRSRVVLAQVLERIRPGDVLVVVRIDRLARSLGHLLEIIDRLDAAGAHFRSLRDPIDTASPQGKFTLQVLGAAAEFERALIRERTIAGLKTARDQGRIGGNPGLRAKDPKALRKISQARAAAYLEELGRTAPDWVPLVRRLRPDMPWQDLVRVINARLPQGKRPWSKERLIRAVKRYVSEGFLEAPVLHRARRSDVNDRLMTIVAGIAGADPELGLQAICDRLEKMREPTPRGRAHWQPSSVRMLLTRAKANGLL